MTTSSSSARPAADPRPARVAAGPGRWLAALLLTPLIAGCATSFGAQTSQVYQPGPGITVRDSDVYVLNAFIVTDGRGNGTLVAGLINQKPARDALEAVSVTGPGGKPISATILPGMIALRDQSSVQLADTGAVRVAGALTAGVNYQLGLTFKNAAPVTMTIPVLGKAGEFQSVPLGPVPSPTTPSH